MKPPSKKMDVPVPVWLWLCQVKVQLTQQRGRTVTFPEVWEWLMQQEAGK